MPLTQSSSNAAFKSNVKAEMAANKPRDQALAVAYAVKRRNRAEGGDAWSAHGAAKGMMHSGPINSVVPGRTDNHPMNVKSASYVLPADHVSSLGQGNTQAGMAVLSQMFGKTGPYGAGYSGIKRGPGAPRPVRAGRPGKLATGGSPELDSTGQPVPINAAGGEYVIEPDVVLAIGGGDIAAGHAILDDWVVSNRKQHVKTLKTLPGPAKS